MQLKIKTLSPLHIGNGESYNGLSYLVDLDKNHIFLFNSDKVMDNLTDREKKLFVQWIEEQSLRIDEIENQMRSERDKNRKEQIRKDLRSLQNKFNLKWFLERINNNQAISRKFYSNYSYFLPIFDRVYDAVNIECFIKQNDNKVYIPGTEIKGAIRNTVLYYMFKQDVDFLRQKIEEFGKKYREKINMVRNKRLDPKMRKDKKWLVSEMGKIEEEIQRKVFRCDKNNDARYDLLKNLFVGDTNGKTPSECLFVSNLKVININHSVPIFQELCKAGVEFTCQGFSLQNNNLILEKLGFSKEQRWVVEDVSHLFKCCYEFSNKLIDEEIGYFQSKYHKIADKLEEIKSQNTEDSPVIRIGKGQGYLSLTLGLLIKDIDPNLYNNVLIHATKNTSYTNNFPKTRKIVNLGKDKFDTIGWVKLIKEGKDA